MTSSLRQKIKKSLIFLSLLIFGLFCPLHSAKAFVDILASLIAIYIAAFFYQLLLALSNLFLSLCSVILNWVLSENFIAWSYTNPANNPIIEVGWGIIRDLTNMFFLVALVFIGLATALKIKEYQFQKTLPRLIFIALLINFTPVICGVIVDGSNIIMNFFIEKLSGMELFINSFAAQGAIIRKAISGWYNPLNVLESVFQALIMIFFNNLASIIFLLFAGLFIMRYVAIWILVILSPLAFFSYIFKATEKFFEQWWNQFIQWCTIGISAAFFLYLGNHILLQAPKMIQPAPPTAGVLASIWIGFLNTILPYAIALVFLTIGFLSALSSSAWGTKAIMTAVKKWSREGVKWATTTAGKAITKRAKAWAIEKAPKEWREKAEQWAKAPIPGTAEPGIKGALKRSAWGPVYALRRRLITPLTLATKAERDEIEKVEEEVKNVSVEDILTKMRKPETILTKKSRAELIAWLRGIVKRPREKGIDKLFKKGFSGAEYRDILNKAIATETDKYKLLVTAMPETAPLINATISPAKAREGVISRIEPEQVRQMSENSLKLQKNKDAIIKYWGYRHMSEIKEAEITGEIIRTMNEKYEEIKNREIKKGQKDEESRRLAFRELLELNRDLLKWRLTSSQAQKSPHFSHEMLFNPKTGKVYSSREWKIISAATPPTPPTRPPFPGPP